MKKIFIIIISGIVLQCIGVYQKDRYTDKVPYNSPRMEATLFIIELENRDLKGNLYNHPEENQKISIEGFKTTLRNNITDCRCFSSFDIVGKFDDLKNYSSYKNRIAIKVITKINNSFFLNYYVTGLSLGIIPTWNKFEYSYEVKLLKNDKPVSSKQYSNRMTEIRHLFLIFNYLYNAEVKNVRFPLVDAYSDVTQKMLKDIYDEKMIPIG